MGGDRDGNPNVTAKVMLRNLSRVEFFCNYPVDGDLDVKLRSKLKVENSTFGLSKDELPYIFTWKASAFPLEHKNEIRKAKCTIVVVATCRVHIGA